MASLKPKGPNGKILLDKLAKELFLNAIAESRSSQAADIENYNFNKSRCRVLSEEQEVKEDSKGVVYWMNRDCRVQDNWALLYSQRLARKFNLPLYVCVFLQDNGKIITKRHLKFFIEGLKDVDVECRSLNINFHVFNASPSELVGIVKEKNIGAVICEFNPLRKQIYWQELLKKDLPSDVPLVQVDAHNIVPAWITSEKQEHMARTIRPKIMKNLNEYLTGFPQVSKHQYVGGKIDSDSVIDVDKVSSEYPVDESDASELTWAVGGYKPGIEMLRTFLTERLRLYGEHSNDASKNATSNLSPWLNFGHISPQRAALEVKSLKDMFSSQVEKYLEELIVRRELTDNFCYYNEHYDSLKGASEWAIKTLNEHRKDKREYVYTKEEFTYAKTHDEIWNGAQLQLLQDGKIHNYMRMYWCKKILEWTKSPEEAIEFGLYLNDTYSLDGSDPNGFVGVMWSICGVHDQGWRERAVFGKIRFMVDYSLRKKFDIDAYLGRYIRNYKPSKEQTGSKKGIKRKKGEK